MLTKRPARSVRSVVQTYMHRIPRRPPRFLFTNKLFKIVNYKFLVASLLFRFSTYVSCRTNKRARDTYGDCGRNRRPRCALQVHSYVRYSHQHGTQAWFLLRSCRGLSDLDCRVATLELAGLKIRLSSSIPSSIEAFIHLRNHVESHLWKYFWKNNKN